MEQNVYSTTQAAKKIGVKTHRLKYAIENGDVEDATSSFLGKRVFTDEDIERLKIYFQSKEGEKK